ncbi:MAG: YbaL family putative K(+) efflux transporter [Gemmatimonadaceae bacterium]
MPHDTALITTIAVGLGLAFVLGLAATKVGMPPLVGYLIAGIAVGPYTPGLVADSSLAQQLAEIGVILLMFGVGIHFSLRDLLTVKLIAVPGAIVQIAVATVLGAVVSHLWGWSWGSGIVFGLCLSVASTVVLLRALEDRGLLDSVDGRIAVGWLIVEDVATVLVLVLLPAFAPALGAEETAGTASSGLILTLAITLGKLALFFGLIFVVGMRAVPWLLERVAHTGSRELFTLAVLAVALGIAVGAAAVFGVSVALGAFFAGVVVSESDLSHEAAADALPLKDAFSVLFFVAVGMLFDPRILVEQPLQILSVLLIVMVGKSLAALGIVLFFRYPLHTALTISASLAQVGEFSFILAALGVTLGLLPVEGQGLIVAVAILSISLNPLAFSGTRWLNRWVTAKPGLLVWIEREAIVKTDLPKGPHSLRNHVIMVGHGRVGSIVAAALAKQEAPYVVVEADLAKVESLRSRGVSAFFGDASRGGVLDQANLADARMLIVTSPDPYKTRAIIEAAREKNPGIDTVVRTHGERERQYLERMNVGLAVMGEQELANAMAGHAIRTLEEPA